MKLKLLAPAKERMWSLDKSPKVTRVQHSAFSHFLQSSGACSF